ncbi:hypothetical protein GQ43DRAFT_494517 [Delitschia confertaspora ATCC 74209]|uniref:Uncharacterized protein n=1 Tax=Delitschia confertaspora ATCC 74209 TaxID=1513339 RepID=A0A9P4MM82_9PLEO|nr:hypothetical protein GQ43DRAFT_494517 [Delitschia confertaspora ATCC 74209]
MSSLEQQAPEAAQVILFGPENESIDERIERKHELWSKLARAQSMYDRLHLALKEAERMPGGSLLEDEAYTNGVETRNELTAEIQVIKQRLEDIPDVEFLFPPPKSRCVQLEELDGKLYGIAMSKEKHPGLEGMFEGYSAHPYYPRQHLHDDPSLSQGIDDLGEIALEQIEALRSMRRPFSSARGEIRPEGREPRPCLDCGQDPPTEWCFRVRHFGWCIFHQRMIIPGAPSCPDHLLEHSEALILGMVGEVCGCWIVQFRVGATFG